MPLFRGPAGNSDTLCTTASEARAPGYLPANGRGFIFLKNNPMQSRILRAARYVNTSSEQAQTLYDAVVYGERPAMLVRCPVANPARPMTGIVRQRHA
jgi:hypothetical protein